jgi:hypothetical protein
MKEYHKINSIYKRDEKGRFIDGQFSVPEFDYLKNNNWIWTEKVDGTCIRIIWNHEIQEILIRGKTDNAQMPVFLMERLQKIFTKEKFIELYSDVSLCLYGEGYGARIQKGGGNYKSDGTDFVLFDIKIGEIWLKRDSVEEIANKLNIEIVPVVGIGNLTEALDLIKSKTLKSKWGDFLAEGIVLRPEIELKTRMGQRIITKLKHCDFKEEKI